MQGSSVDGERPWGTGMIAATDQGERAEEYRHRVNEVLWLYELSKLVTRAMNNSQSTG